MSSETSHGVAGPGSDLPQGVVAGQPAGAAARLSKAVEDYQAAVDDFDREVARQLGVNETDLRCLEILVQDTPEATPRQLADRLGLTTGSVTSMLDRLEKMGYLTRSPHPSDRRKLIVRATETASLRAWELMGPLVTEGQQQLLTRYTAGQLGLITDFLTRARDLQEAHTSRLRQRHPYPKP
jgi:DNA-binding MarR family transcriptional regulator